MASARLATFILRRMFLTWNLTVPSETTKARAMSAFDSPLTMCSSTSVSRAVSSSSEARPDVAIGGGRVAVVGEIDHTVAEVDAAGVRPFRDPPQLQTLVASRWSSTARS